MKLELFLFFYGPSHLFPLILVPLRLGPRSASMLISLSPCLGAYLPLHYLILVHTVATVLRLTEPSCSGEAAHILIHLNSAALNIRGESRWWSGPSDFISTHTPSRCIMNRQSGWRESCSTEAQFRKCISDAATRLRQQKRVVTLHERRCRGVALGRGLLADSLRDSGHN